MTTPPPPPSAAQVRSPAFQTLVLIFAFATVFGLISAGQIYIGRTRVNEAVNVGSALIHGLAAWYAWAVVTPLIHWTGRRFPFRRGQIRQALLPHLLVATACLLWYLLIALGVSYLLWTNSEVTEFGSYFRLNLLGYRVTLGCMAYAAILGASQMIEAYKALRDREAQTSRLEAQLAQAHLRALKMQLHPHFLFNALHAIRVLVREDPDAAERTVTRLGDLLRTALAGAETQEVLLRQELDFLKMYLEIETTRFPDRLQVVIAAPEDTLDLLVPHFVLQPLVENAIRHGIAPHPSGGAIEVRAERAGEALLLAVRNDGAPLAPNAAWGIGLTTTRERLERLYGSHANLTLANDAAGGVVATVRLPLRHG